MQFHHEDRRYILCFLNSNKTLAQVNWRGHIFLIYVMAVVGVVILIDWYVLASSLENALELSRENRASASSEFFFSHCKSSFYS